MYQEKLGTPAFVLFQSPVFTGHCYLWDFHLTLQQGTEPTSLVSLNAEIVGVLSKMVSFLWRACVVGSGLSEKVWGWGEREWLFGMLRELLHEMDLELVSSTRSETVKLIPAPEVCGLSPEMQPEEYSATCFVNDSGTKGWTQYPSTMELRDSLCTETSMQKGILILYFDLGM